jgi:hypothetical protein
MKKILQILFALILILILTYITFINTSTTIQNNLISKAKILLKDNNITGINIKIEGEGLKMQRVLVLTGSVSTYKKKIDIGSLTQNIEGVLGVNNQITIVSKGVQVQVAPTPTPTPTLTPIFTPTPTAKVTITPKQTIAPVIINIKPTFTPISTPVVSTKTTVESIITIPTHNEITEPITEPIIDIPTVATVPKVIQNSINVPIPIKPVAVPIPIKTEGVK